MNQKALPLGIDGFRKLREGDYYYTDKSMLIADFLKTGAEVTLITRPRRFGKTLNMDMVKEFFDIEANSKDIFSGLAIMDTSWKEAMNTTPVISLSFRDCKGDKAILIFLIKQELLREYRRFEHCAKDLAPMDQTIYNEIIGCLVKSDEEIVPISRAIAFLSQIVSEYYHKNPIILIDEYDTPMTSAYTEGFYDELRSFFTALYASALKGNPYLDKALLTGIQRIAKENIFSGLNNLVVCTVNDRAYSEYFGFNPQEAQALLESYGLELNDEVKKMYDGYRFADQEMYNPWSLISYASSHELAPCWVNTSSNTLIRQTVLKASDSFLRQFDELILNGSIKTMVNLSTSFFELQDDATLWGLLMNSGYVTVNRVLNLQARLYEIRIPNSEVGQEFQNIVAQRTRIESGYLAEMFYYLIQERNLEEFQKVYKRIVSSCTSYFDAKENAYHMLMLGMCVYLSGTYEINSNLEAGKGRSDITLKAKERGYPHIIMEFKQGEDLEKLSRQALEQIHEKEYYDGLAGEILLLGVAHNKKDCVIQSEMLSK